jgi:hypothetical protein
MMSSGVVITREEPQEPKILRAEVFNTFKRRRLQVDSEDTGGGMIVVRVFHAEANNDSGSEVSCLSIDVIDFQDWARSVCELAGLSVN